jgi:hypothetical protein
VILGLGLAALLHGLFDFFLMVPLEKLLAGSYIVAFFMAREVHRMLSNALNTSPRCPEAPPAKMQLRSFGLFLLSTLAITLIVYLDYHTGFSTEIANRQVPLLGLSALPGLIVVSGSLGKITLARGRIIPINNFAYHRAFRKRAGKTGMIPGGCGAQ